MSLTDEGDTTQHILEGTVFVSEYLRESLELN